MAMKRQHEEPCGDGKVFDCMDVNILVVILYSSFCKMLPLGKIKGYQDLSLYYFLQLPVHLQFSQNKKKKLN